MMPLTTRNSLNILYVFTILLAVALLYSLIVGAPIIQQVEAEIGHTLTCQEAYQHREIDAYLYNNYRTQGDILYWANVFMPVWVGFVLLMLLAAGVIARIRRQVQRLNWLLAGLTLTLLVPILIYWPVIQKIACATE